MKKNPFKKQAIIDTVINVGIGGAANVAIDYAVASIDALKNVDVTIVNAVKVGVGALGGTMTTNKFIRAAVDGIATVGASQLVKGLFAPISGLPDGTIGRVRLGNKAYRRSVRGVNATPSAFMSK